MTGHDHDHDTNLSLRIARVTVKYSQTRMQQANSFTKTEKSSHFAKLL